MSSIRLEAPDLGKDLATNGPSVSKPYQLIEKKEKKDPNNPATTSESYDLMYPRWAKIETLLGGTEAMRLASTNYLPQHPEESAMAYGARLERATLFNMTELTLEGWVGKPFDEPVKLSEDMPENVIEWMNDIDLQGNNANVFARQVFREGVAKGFTHIMVDMPRVEPKLDGTPRTLEDDRKENRRPYLVHIKPEQVIFAFSELINGEEKVTHLRIMEAETKMVGYAEITIRTIKVFTPGLVVVYEERKVKNKVKWVQVDAYSYDLPYIPIVTFYASREGFMCAKPPLTDLADLNIAHWQSNSDQTVILTTARFPMLALSGAAPEDNKLTVGPNSWLYSSDPQSKYYYVEHQGAAIGAGREDLRSLEEQMAAYGSQYLKKKVSGATATERVIDSAEATSPLQDMTIRFTDAMNTAIFIMGDWAKIETPGTITISTEFGADEDGSPEIIKLILEARKQRILSRKATITEFKLRGVLAEDFDEEANESDLEKEAQEGMSGEAESDLDPEQEDKDDPTV